MRNLIIICLLALSGISHGAITERFPILFDDANLAITRFETANDSTTHPGKHIFTGNFTVDNLTVSDTFTAPVMTIDDLTAVDLTVTDDTQLAALDVSGTASIVSTATFGDSIILGDDDSILFGVSNDINMLWDSSSGYAIFDVTGDLHLNPLTGGDVELFAEVDVGNASDGKELVIHRRAAESDQTFTFKINQFEVGVLTASGAFQLSAGGSLVFNQAGGGNISMFENATALNKFLLIYGGVSGSAEYTDLSVQSDGYFHIGRENANILGVIIDEDDFPLHIGETVNDFKLIFTDGVGGIISTATEDIRLQPAGLDVIIGDNSDNDFTITFDADSNDGVFSWDEDNTIFTFAGGSMEADGGYNFDDNILTVGDAGSEYSTVALAIAAASSGDVILVMTGTYAEKELTVPVGVALRGADGQNCIISVTHTVSSESTVILSDGSSLSNITIGAIATTAIPCNAVEVISGADVIIRNVTLIPEARHASSVVHGLILEPAGISANTGIDISNSLIKTTSAGKTGTPKGILLGVPGTNTITLKATNLTIGDITNHLNNGIDLSSSTHIANITLTDVDIYTRSIGFKVSSTTAGWITADGLYLWSVAIAGVECIPLELNDIEARVSNFRIYCDLGAYTSGTGHDAVWMSSNAGMDDKYYSNGVITLLGVSGTDNAAFYTQTANAATIYIDNVSIYGDGVGGTQYGFNETGSQTINFSECTVEGVDFLSSGTVSGTAFSADGTIKTPAFILHAGDLDTYLKFDTDVISMVADSDTGITLSTTAVTLGSQAADLNTIVSGNSKNAWVYDWGADEHQVNSLITTTDNLKLTATDTAQLGVIMKGANRFIHDFSHPYGDSAVPAGFNVFLGDRAGNFTMGSTATSTAHGSYNVGIGLKSLLANEIGYYNVGIGSQALIANTSGNSNMAIGRNTLLANTTGSQNTALGSNAGLRNISGDNNIYLGIFAGAHQTTVNNQLFIDNQDRGSTANELVRALIYGVFNADPLLQTLFFHAATEIGSDTDHVLIGTDGQLSLIGDARVVKSIAIENADLGKGSSAPSQVIVGHYDVWEFGLGPDDDAVFTFHMPHDWEVGTDVILNVDWQINETGDTIQWRIAYKGTPHDSSEAITGAGTTLNSGDILIPGTVRFLTQTAFTLSAANLAANDQVGVTLTRVAAGGVAPNNEPGVTDIHIEYTANKLGEGI